MNCETHSLRQTEMPAGVVGRAPDFLIIGAAKSGTTTLRTYLSRHPQLFVPADWEPEFFADKYHRGWDWYTLLFAEAADDQRVGESSPIYTWWQEYPECAARIAETLPAAKLIYILRHPVERTYSQYLEQIRTRDHKGVHRPALESFDEFVDHYEHFVWAGEYMRFIDEYLQYYPREQLLVLLLEDLKRDPRTLVARVLRFLEVDDRLDLTQAGHVHGKRSDDWVQWRARRRLTAPLRKVPGLRSLLGGLTPRPVREAIYRLIETTSLGGKIRQDAQAPPLLPATRRRLLERFREPTRRLAEFVGRDLSHWQR